MQPKTRISLGHLCHDREDHDSHTGQSHMRRPKEKKQVDGHVAVIVPAMSAYVFAPESRRMNCGGSGGGDGRDPGCLGFMSGMKFTTQLCGDCFINHEKDPY